MGSLVDLLKNNAEICKKRILCVTLLFIMFVVGIVCGVVIKKPNVVKEYFENYAAKYLESVFSLPLGKILVKRLINTLILVLFACLTVVLVFFFPFSVAIVFFKGYALGCIAVVFCSSYSFLGIFAFFSVFLLQNLCFCFGYILFLTICFDFGVRGGCIKRGNFLYFLPYLCLYSVYFILCALLELLLAGVFFRAVFSVL